VKSYQGHTEGKRNHRDKLTGAKVGRRKTGRIRDAALDVFMRTTKKVLGDSRRPGYTRNSISTIFSLDGLRSRERNLEPEDKFTKRLRLGLFSWPAQEGENYTDGTRRGEKRRTWMFYYPIWKGRGMALRIFDNATL